MFKWSIRLPEFNGNSDLFKKNYNSRQPGVIICVENNEWKIKVGICYLLFKGIDPGRDESCSLLNR